MKIIYTIERIREEIKKCTTYADLQRNLGYNVKGGNVYRKLKSIIEENKIDVSHFKGKAHGTSKNIRIPIEDILVEKSTYRNFKSLKSRLVREGIIEYSCKICGINEWNGGKLTLQLDHINGINDDNRIANIRLLCPNCHSQTETFGGGNLKK
jgi:5-methylcytosine-specific restriction endonuclease McrA